MAAHYRKGNGNLFRHPNGRLKITQITLLVFLMVLVGLSLGYKAGKSADKVMVEIEHLFEATVEEAKKATNSVLKKVQPPAEKKVIQKKLQPPEKVVEKKSRTKPVSEKPDRSKPNIKKDKIKSKVADNQLLASNKPASPEPLKKPDVVTPGTKKMVINHSDTARETTNKGSVKLSSKPYFEAFQQWHNQGKELDSNKKLVPLRIENLEKRYELFQMKVVVLKDGVPHTDLGDGSRIAAGSLIDFSSTCFVVSDPWSKWGNQIRNAGLDKNETIEVRYYTYDIVRNAIYARAIKAFEWTAKKSGISQPVDPLTADVLGAVFSISREGGGKFGVFVPLQVDFQSGETIKVDPLACFTGQKDIEAILQAGLL